MAGGGDCGGSVSGDSASSVVGGATAGGGKTEPWSRVKDSRYFSELLRRGEPDMRPDCGRIVLARMAGMAELEERFRGRALLATVEGELRVTAAALLAAMEV